MICYGKGREERMPEQKMTASPFAGCRRGRHRKCLEGYSWQEKKLEKWLPLRTRQYASDQMLLRCYEVVVLLAEVRMPIISNGNKTINKLRPNDSAICHKMDISSLPSKKWMQPATRSRESHNSKLVLTPTALVALQTTAAPRHFTNIR